MAMLTALFRRPAGKQVTWHPQERLSSWGSISVRLSMQVTTYSRHQVEKDLKAGLSVWHLLGEAALHARYEAGETAIIVQRSSEVPTQAPRKPAGAGV